MVLLDGSCGSFLWNLAEENGIDKDPTWTYNLTHPELVEEMTRRYFDAGSDMVQTNTFAANSFSTERSGYDIRDVIAEAVRIGKSVNENIYLSSGPLSMLLEPYGPMKKEECERAYREIFEVAAKEGVKAIMLETFMDIRMMEIAAKEAVRYGLPVCCSMTFEKRHRTMMGDTIRSIVDALSFEGISSVGMNCSYGPAEGLKIIKDFRENTALPLYFKPNAGMGSTYDADTFVSEVSPSLEFVEYIGACCGSDDNYIKKLREKIHSS